MRCGLCEPMRRFQALPLLLLMAYPVETSWMYGSTVRTHLCANVPSPQNVQQLSLMREARMAFEEGLGDPMTEYASSPRIATVGSVMRQVGIVLQILLEDFLRLPSTIVHLEDYPFLSNTSRQAICRGDYHVVLGTSSVTKFCSYQPEMKRSAKRMLDLGPAIRTGLAGLYYWAPEPLDGTVMYDWYTAYTEDSSSLVVFNGSSLEAALAAEEGSADYCGDVDWCVNNSYTPSHCNSTSVQCGIIFHPNADILLWRGYLEALVNTHRLPFAIRYIGVERLRALAERGQPYIAFLPFGESDSAMVRINFPSSYFDSSGQVLCDNSLDSVHNIAMTPLTLQYCDLETLVPHLLVEKDWQADFASASSILVEFARELEPEDILHLLNLSSQALSNPSSFSLLSSPNVNLEHLCHFVTNHYQRFRALLHNCYTGDQQIEYPYNAQRIGAPSILSPAARRIAPYNWSCVCAPGWRWSSYDLGTGWVTCEECPAGSVCAGGRDQVASISCGNSLVSTGRRRRTQGPNRIVDCECDPGYETSPDYNYEADEQFNWWEVRPNQIPEHKEFYQEYGTICTACPAGFYKDYQGAGPCYLCPANTTSGPGASGIEFCMCQAGYYRVSAINASIVCRLCKESEGGQGAACELGIEPRALPGFIMLSHERPDGRDLRFSLCPIPEACQGSNQCAEGTGGPACTVCLGDYVQGGAQSKYCQPCRSYPANYVKFVIGSTIISFVGFYFAAVSHHSEQNSIPLLVKVVLHHSFIMRPLALNDEWGLWLSAFCSPLTNLIEEFVHCWRCVRLGVLKDLLSDLQIRPVLALSVAPHAGVLLGGVLFFSFIIFRYKHARRRIRMKFLEEGRNHTKELMHMLGDSGVNRGIFEELEVRDKARLDMVRRELKAYLEDLDRESRLSGIWRATVDLGERRLIEAVSIKTMYFCQDCATILLIVFVYVHCVVTADVLPAGFLWPRSNGFYFFGSDIHSNQSDVKYFWLMFGLYLAEIVVIVIGFLLLCIWILRQTLKSGSDAVDARKAEEAHTNLKAVSRFLCLGFQEDNLEKAMWEIVHMLHRLIVFSLTEQFHTPRLSMVNALVLASIAFLVIQSWRAPYITWFDKFFVRITACSSTCSVVVALKYRFQAARDHGNFLQEAGTESLEGGFEQAQPWLQMFMSISVEIILVVLSLIFWGMVAMQLYRELARYWYSKVLEAKNREIERDRIRLAESLGHDLHEGTSAGTKTTTTVGGNLKTVNTMASGKYNVTARSIWTDVGRLDSFMGLRCLIVAVVQRIIKTRKETLAFTMGKSHRYVGLGRHNAMREIKLYNHRSDVEVAIINDGIRGVGVEYVEEDRKLLITQVNDGLIHEWNKHHPRKAIAPGDMIVGVNNIRENPDKMVNILTTAVSLYLIIRRKESLSAACSKCYHGNKGRRDRSMFQQVLSEALKTYFKKLSSVKNGALKVPYTIIDFFFADALYVQQEIAQGKRFRQSREEVFDFIWNHRGGQAEGVEEMFHGGPGVPELSSQTQGNRMAELANSLVTEEGIDVLRNNKRNGVLYTNELEHYLSEVREVDAESLRQNMTRFTKVLQDAVGAGSDAVLNTSGCKHRGIQVSNQCETGVQVSEHADKIQDAAAELSGSGTVQPAAEDEEDKVAGKKRKKEETTRRKKAKEGGSELHVEIVSGYELPDHDTEDSVGASDPYATVEFDGSPETRMTSRICPDTLDPVWNFSAILTGWRQGNDLLFKVHDADFDTLKGDDIIGTVLLKSERFEKGAFEDELALEVNLRAHENIHIHDDSVPRILVRVSFGFSEDNFNKVSSVATSRRPSGQENNALPYWFDAADGSGELLGETQAFSMAGRPQSSPRWSVAANRDVLGDDIDVGDYVLVRQEFLSQSKVLLRPLECGIARAEYQGNLEVHFETEGIQVVTRRDRDKLAKRADRTMPSELKTISLTVTIVGASNLRNADHTLSVGNVSDPYCVLDVLDRPQMQTISTGVLKDTLNPSWMHTELMAHYEPGDALRFQVWDRDELKEDDFLGCAILKSAQFFPAGFSGELELSDPRSKKVKKLPSSLEVRIRCNQVRGDEFEGEEDSEYDSEEERRAESRGPFRYLGRMGSGMSQALTRTPR